MSHARDRYVNSTRENHKGNPHLEPRYYLDYLPYNFQKVIKNMASSRYVRQTEEEMERLLSEKDSKKIKQFQQIYGIMMSIKFGCGRIWIRMSILTSLLDTSWNCKCLFSLCIPSPPPHPHLKKKEK